MSWRLVRFLLLSPEAPTDTHGNMAPLYKKEWGPGVHVVSPLAVILLLVDK